MPANTCDGNTTGSSALWHDTQQSGHSGMTGGGVAVRCSENRTQQCDDGTRSDVTCLYKQRGGSTMAARHTLAAAQP